uniref:Uncharacterized protein n=1 Tax=Anguilla anguilla TaxID=7936 RepID=A0A0E9VQB1_ANGAN
MKECVRDSKEVQCFGSWTCFFSYSGNV